MDIPFSVLSAKLDRVLSFFGIGASSNRTAFKFAADLKITAGFNSVGSIFPARTPFLPAKWFSSLWVSELKVMLPIHQPRLSKKWRLL